VYVEQQSDQLRYRDGRVRVVQVDRGVLGQVCERPMLGQVARNDVLHRGRHEEVLLAQAQFPAGRRAVVRIQNPGDAFEAILELGRSREVAAIERIEVQMCGRGGLPQAQRRDAVGAVSRNHHVEGLGPQFVVRTPLCLVVVTALDPASKVDFVAHLGARKLPRRAIVEP